MIETHPFGSFVPPKAKYLILGSFTGKIGDSSYDWFYGSKRNQFWPILEIVYKTELKIKKDKQALFKKLRMAIADIIYQCERKKGSNLDINLTNIVYNLKAIEKILKSNRIERIYFSSRFVENRFKQAFKKLIQEYPGVQLFTLPSPSPRYAVLSLKEKIKKYNKLLPQLRKASPCEARKEKHQMILKKKRFVVRHSF